MFGWTTGVVNANKRWPVSTSTTFNDSCSTIYLWKQTQMYKWSIEWLIKCNNRVGFYKHQAHRNTCAISPQQWPHSNKLTNHNSHLKKVYFYFYLFNCSVWRRFFYSSLFQLFFCSFHFSYTDFDCFGQIMASRTFHVLGLREANLIRYIQWTWWKSGLLGMLCQKILRNMPSMPQSHRGRK